MKIRENSLYLAPSQIKPVQNLPGEKWRNIPTLPAFYYCSNMGRFKIIDSNNNEMELKKIKAKNKTGKLYTDVNIRCYDEEGNISKKATLFRTSRVLMKAWKDETLKLEWKDDKRDVNHIDNNPSNEEINNLEVVSHSENIKAAIYSQGQDVGKKKKPCYAYDIKEGKLLKFESTGKLVETIWGKNNNGYFNNAYKNKFLVKDRYYVGYDADEVEKLGDDLFLEYCHQIKNEDDKRNILNKF